MDINDTADINDTMDTCDTTDTTDTIVQDIQSIKEKERQIFIKLENIESPLTSYQVISFPNTIITLNELISRIRDHYNITSQSIRLELWTGPLGTRRVQIDNYKYVPENYDTFWVRGYIINNLS